MGSRGKYQPVCLYDKELPNNYLTSCHRRFIRKELPENDENPVVVNNQTDASGIHEIEQDSPGTAETAGHNRPSAEVETRSMRSIGKFHQSGHKAQILCKQSLFFL